MRPVEGLSALRFLLLPALLFVFRGIRPPSDYSVIAPAVTLPDPRSLPPRLQPRGASGSCSADSSFRMFFNTKLGLKVSTLRASSRISWPVWGLRPLRAFF